MPEGAFYGQDCDRPQRILRSSTWTCFLKPQTKTRVTTFEHGVFLERDDVLVTEEPLELRVNNEMLTTTMRTPGHDLELCLGWLFNEGIIQNSNDVYRISHDPNDELENTVNVELHTNPKLEQFKRQTLTSSACGVCGTASLENLKTQGLQKLNSRAQIDTKTLLELPKKLRASQDVFDVTGGIHAAALFTLQGDLIASREDIGRHNAVDKLIGWMLLENLMETQEFVMLTSGRCGFEIAQKCLAARVSILASVSAPSSLAVELANEFCLTLVGFLRDERFNVYANPERILSA
jgi:FdhD protein